MDKKVTMVVDLQFGSTGKGLICGYWAEKNSPDVVVTCNMPNAGHTYIDSKGNKMIHKVLPNGIVSPALQYVLIGPGAVFSLERLHEEIEQAQGFGYLENVEVVIHPDAMVLSDRHKFQEQQTLSKISSTMQGSAEAVIEKMRRGMDANRAAKVRLDGAGEYGAPLPDWFNSAVCSHQEWIDILRGAKVVLAEGSQGWSLGINSGFYPFCTSRDCTPARFLSDMGIPYNMLRKVIGTARTFPIRVGNTPDGYSGDCYADQIETSFEQIGVADEFTTVTGRKRRIFTFSYHQISEAAFYCAPDEIFLNFTNYIDNPKVLAEMIEGIEQHTNAKVRYLGSGPTFEDVNDTESAWLELMGGEPENA